MSNEKARFLFHVFYNENMKKHIGNAKFGNNATSSAPTFGSKPRATFGS